MQKYTSVSDFIKDIYRIKLELISIGVYGMKWATTDEKEVLLNRKDYIWVLKKIHD